MGRDEKVTRRLDEFEETLGRLGDVEARLSRVRARRRAVPASLVLFVVLAFVLLRDEIASTPSAGYVWFMLFGAGYATGLIVNEVTARRAIPLLENELATLRTRYQRRSTPASGKLPPDDS